MAKLKQLLGVPAGERIGAVGYRDLLASNKQELVKARQAGDDKLAAALSLGRSVLKRRVRPQCPGTPNRECGVTISKHATHCRVCRQELGRPKIIPALPPPVTTSRGPGRRVSFAPGVVRAMELAGGNVQEAKRMTGLDERTLERHAGHIRGGQRSVRALSTEHIRGVVERTNKSAAARILGISRRTIWKRLKAERHTA